MPIRRLNGQKLLFEVIIEIFAFRCKIVSTYFEGCLGRLGRALQSRETKISKYEVVVVYKNVTWLEVMMKAD
jgi:hypothetical protein